MSTCDRIQARSIVMTKDGIVAAESPLAAQAGALILSKGGSAVDAAITANTVMSVVAPMSCGIGGDLFAIVYDAASNSLYGLNASGYAPEHLTVELLKAKGFELMPSIGAFTVTVPGVIDGWSQLSAKFGTLGLKELLKPAIHYAEEGFPVTEQVSSLWHETENTIKSDTLLSKAYLINGKIPQPGDMFKNNKLASTYKTIAKDGYESFYKGSIGEYIVKTIKKYGGVLNHSDLLLYKSKWVTLLQTDYHGWTIYEMPPNTQGIAALLMLNIMENFPLKNFGHCRAQSLHIAIEAKKLAYADLMQYIGDPSFCDIPIDELLSKDYAKLRAKQIDIDKANNFFDAGAINKLNGDTVYLCAADKKGNMVSLIQSNFVSATFGSGILVEECGFVLHNRGALFNLNKNHPNCLLPRKKPLHTIIPAFMTKNNFKIAFGIMGGFNQAQAHAQFVANIVDFKQNIQSALEHPRFTKLTFEGNDVMLENRIDKDVIRQLTEKGHKIKLRGSFSQEMGGGQAIMRDYNTSVNFGASDPRKDGEAIPEGIL